MSHLMWTAYIVDKQGIVVGWPWNGFFPISLVLFFSAYCEPAVTWNCSNCWQFRMLQVAIQGVFDKLI